MLTELSFCRKSSINISIDNRYYNRFIHLGKPILPVNHNGGALCLQSLPHLGLHIQVSGCYTREAPVAQSATWVGSSLLDSSMLLLFRQPIKSPMILCTASPTCLLVQINCNRFNDHRRLIIFSALATSPTPPAIPNSPCILHWWSLKQSCHFFLLAAVIAGDCAITLAFHVLRR